MSDYRYFRYNEFPRKTPAFVKSNPNINKCLIVNYYVNSGLKVKIFLFHLQGITVKVNMKFELISPNHKQQTKWYGKRIWDRMTDKPR